jgi:hypothetical protein
METPNTDPNQVQPNATPMPGAVDTGNAGAPQSEVQAAPVAAAQSQASPAADAGVPPITKTSPNPHMHNLISRVLGAMAGPPPTTYTADPSTGKLVASAVPMSNTQKIGRIVNTALIGLSAPTPDGARPSILGGMGAGFAQVGKVRTAEDAAAQKKTREDFEQEQQTKLRQLDIAKANAINISLHEANLRDQNERDNDRGQNTEIANAFKTMPDHGVREMSAEAAKAAVLDPNNQTWAHTHLILPAGFQDVTDSNGNPLKTPDGNFKTEGRVYVIDGMRDGKVPIPASIVSDVQKYKNYGDLANVPGLDSLKEGDEYEPKQFIRLYNAMLSAKKEVIGGWGKPEAVEGSNGEILQRNTVNGETKPATQEQKDAYLDRKAKRAETESITKKNNAEAVKALADAEKARKDALAKDTSGKHVDVFGNSSPLDEKEFNKRYDSFNKSKQYQNLQVLQGSYQQFQQAVNDINAGKDLTGAASVVGLFNAIGISATPLQGKGFRINENTIREHVDARGLDQAAYQKLLSLKSGAVITPQQLKDYANIAAGVYRDSYVNTANEQRRQLGYIDVLPLGNNDPIDPMTAQLYLKVAGNDPAKARAAAQKNGWAIPQ